ncbi:glycosyltransferase family 39 protein [Maribellus sp. YY47]|uniref:ArnT family glycosyltransferase n=1 Tax=Maribellus sp. YY47 TaxID=2929486 RepID=UPI002000BD78|nr:glycosyltransferase family 39 protein [Maribellus sp. YY47]MCK3682622.1 glycosyltransferase family 39 protein [Maribellus sp. YY47]
MTKDRYFILTAVVLVLIVIVASLPVPLLVNAAKYAQVGREILVNHDWINLTIGGEAYDQKPPMLFWLAAVMFSVFGYSASAYKISVITVSLLGIYSTYRLGKFFYGKETGLLAALFWGTSLGYLHFHNDIHTDTMMVSFVVFSVWQFMAYFKERKWYQFILGAVGVGLSMVTKGPVGLLIPAFAVGASLLVHKQWRDIFNLRWLVAALIVGIIIIPALLGLFRQFGLEGIKFYFWTNNMGRVTGSYQGTNNDYSFYIHTSLYMLLPWTVFLVVAMFDEIKSLVRLKKSEIKTVEVANIAAVVFFLGILSVAKQKNPHYMLSAIPFMFIITAKWTVRNFAREQFAKKAKVISVINKVVTVLFLAMIPFMSAFFFPETRILYWIIVVLMAGGAVYFVLRKIDLKKQMLMLLLASSALLFTINYNMLPNMCKYETSIEAAEIFNKMAEPGATLNIYGEKARLWELLFYSDSYGTYLQTPEMLDDFLPHPGAWIYTTEAGYAEMQEKGIEMEVAHEFTEHKKVTSQSINFLNPNKRASRFQKMYLLILR